MLNHVAKFKLPLLGFFAFGLLHCGSGFDPSSPEGQSVALYTAAANLDLDNDVDQDGVYVTCDGDDNDVTNTSLLQGCDDDADGYVDTACTTYADENGVFSADRLVEIGVNCDLCPGSSLDQTDDNEDGVGDSCDPDIGGADININAPAS